MSFRRLTARVASARFVAVAALPEHALRFHKMGLKDRSGKCDAAHTGDSEDRVIGVVFEISATDKRRLDRIEGLGFGYREKEAEVVAENGERFNVRLYVARHIDPSWKPYHWYKNHVLTGARENGLPAGYIARIEAVESVTDRDHKRCEREFSIYRQ
ncbi:gamma-glutamylcyclotransferase [Marinobacter fonticola]|uniref:gamma-glutamylcyclotransferase n=1 Tax=Marinobacter fonticola TaxID=2603215 RepID=UPI0022287D92|nr:gamma-glutamylcyclotransferase [Marinobacter fonticola]